MELRNRYGEVIHSNPNVRDGDVARVVMLAMLSEKDLRCVDLSGADLRGVCFAGYDLSEANFNAAQLEGADFQGCDLEDALFEGASCAHANFSRADLTDATFSRATVEHARFTRAHLDGTVFYLANLCDAELRDIREDVYLIIEQVPDEVPYLIETLNNGNINGQVYDGPCSCLVGTIARVKGVSIDNIRGVKRNAERPAERFVGGISSGDTPSNSAVARELHTWLTSWVAARTPRQVDPIPEPAAVEPDLTPNQHAVLQALMLCERLRPSADARSFAISVLDDRIVTLHRSLHEGIYTESESESIATHIAYLRECGAYLRGRPTNMPALGDSE